MDFIFPDHPGEDAPIAPKLVPGQEEIFSKPQPPLVYLSGPIPLDFKARFDEFGFDPLRHAKDLGLFIKMFFGMGLCLLVETSEGHPREPISHRFIPGKATSPQS